MAEKEYIERAALLAEYDRVHVGPPGGARKLIEEAPAADVVEVVHGEWVVTKTEFGWNSAEYPTEYTCSVCGRTESNKEPYCNCGAKMDGKENRE